MFVSFFLDQQRSVDERCFEHLLFAGGFALRLLGAGVAARCTRWSHVCLKKLQAR